MPPPPMDMTPPPAGEGLTPDSLGDTAQLSAQVVAREHPQEWAATGLPSSLAALDTPLETVWAAVQLALSGANYHTLASTLGLSEQTARHIIIATTEQVLADPGEAEISGDESSTGAGVD